VLWDNRVLTPNEVSIYTPNGEQNKNLLPKLPNVSGILGTRLGGNLGSWRQVG
jgi:hypothetical protein